MRFHYLLLYIFEYIYITYRLIILYIENVERDYAMLLFYFFILFICICTFFSLIFISCILIIINDVACFRFRFLPHFI